jgi:hypothetical protein
MPEIQYPKNPNSDTAFVVQEDGTKNRALMTAPQDTSSLELPTNSNSCKGYVTVDGKKQRVILTADIGSGGGATYTAGNGISIDANNEISVTAPTLVNNTTQTGSLAIGVSTSCNSVHSVALGSGSQAGNAGVVAIGYGASSQYGISIGRSANTTALGGVALGDGAKAKANGAVQINAHPFGSAATNSDANTFKVANANGNFELMSADGTVPTARLTKVNTTATLAVADWSSSTQTVTVSGVKADSVVFVSPAPASASDYASAGILCTSQGTNSLTFTATTTPTSAITVNVVCM